VSNEKKMTTQIVKKEGKKNIKRPNFESFWLKNRGKKALNVIRKKA
jgi:hypothetical protein